MDEKLFLDRVQQWALMLAVLNFRVLPPRHMRRMFGYIIYMVTLLVGPCASKMLVLGWRMDVPIGNDSGPYLLTKDPRTYKELSSWG